MDAKEYLKKAMQVCKEHEEEDCNACPLRPYGCGMPGNKNEIDEILRIVEEHKPTKRICRKCKKSLKSIPSEYVCCPWCGEKMAKEN